jgi:tRNA modification GTPase
VVLWNKADLCPPPQACVENLPGHFFALSAKTGEGIPVLLSFIAGLLEKAPAASEGGASDNGCALHNAAGPGTLRQKELIDTALASVEEALDLAERREPLDIIAPLFRSAVNALGEITGEVSNADILETMFGRFCVGK